MAALRASPSPTPCLHTQEEGSLADGLRAAVLGLSPTPYHPVTIKSDPHPLSAPVSVPGLGLTRRAREMGRLAEHYNVLRQEHAWGAGGRVRGKGGKGREEPCSRTEDTCWLSRQQPF